MIAELYGSAIDAVGMEAEAARQRRRCQAGGQPGIEGADVHGVVRAKLLLVLAAALLLHLCFILCAG